MLVLCVCREPTTPPLMTVSVAMSVCQDTTVPRALTKEPIVHREPTVTVMDWKISPSALHAPQVSTAKLMVKYIYQLIYLIVLNTEAFLCNNVFINSLKESYVFCAQV